MVTEYGMSAAVGPIFLGDEQEVFLGKSFSQQRMGFSEEVNSAIDREVHRLIDEGYKRAESILTEHMDKLHALAALLLEREKLDADEFKAFMENGVVPEKAAPEQPQPSPEPAPTEPGEAANGAEAPQEAQPTGTAQVPSQEENDPEV